MTEKGKLKREKFSIKCREAVICATARNKISMKETLSM